MEAPEWADDALSPAQRWRARWADRAAALGRSPLPPVRQAERLAVGQGFVLTTAQARTLGVTRNQVRSLVRRRVWSRPWRGTLAVIGRNLDDRDRIALAATAAALSNPGSVISHASAAVLLGLPIKTSPIKPNLTFGPQQGGPPAGSGWHRTGLDADEMSSWFGLSVTSVERTIADIARGDRAGGLVTADAALRETMTTTTGLQAAAARCAGWPGNRSARWVADHADRQSESPLESLVRAALLNAGLPAPRLQVWIAAARARVDMLYDEKKVVIEVDGMSKYDTDPAGLRNEKRRQERLERAGYRVVRVLYADLIHDLEGTIQRVRDALTPPVDQR